MCRTGQARQSGAAGSLPPNEHEHKQRQLCACYLRDNGAGPLDLNAPAIHHVSVSLQSLFK